MARRSPFATRRARKPRPHVTLKEKAAKRDATCDGCKQRIYKGDTAAYVRTKIRRYHPSCTPQDWNRTTASPVVNPLPTNPADAKLKAMESLENALVVIAKTQGITPEMEKTFDRYQKLKGMALRPGSDQEGITAFRHAIASLVKLVF